MLATEAPQANGRHEPATSPAPVGRPYIVSSVSVAAAVMCAGAGRPLPVLRADGWVVFEFSDADGSVRRLVGQYWRDELPPMPARELFGVSIELRREMLAAKATAKGEQAAGESEGGR